MCSTPKEIKVHGFAYHAVFKAVGFGLNQDDPIARGIHESRDKMANIINTQVHYNNGHILQSTTMYPFNYQIIYVSL